MVREWFAECKDCGDKFGYSDTSQQLSRQRGLSRPERCPKCRQLHSREIATLGLSHFDLTPIMPIPPEGLSPGRLGGLERPKRIHQLEKRQGSVDFAKKFGIQDEHIEAYFELMQHHQVTVVVAPTGAGKSTFLPYRLMVPPEPFPQDLWTRNGQIVITQPRIQATRGIPRYVAEKMHGSTLGPGFDVGYRHSGDTSTDWRNKLVYMTDGSLINMIVRNELSRLSVIMIDEAHERSVNIDLILGLLKTQLPRYPQLKLIIASATINASMFLEYYGAPSGIDPDDKVFKIPTDQGFDLYDNKAIAEQLAGCPVGFYGFPGKRKFPVESRYRVNDPVPIEKFSGRMPEEVAKKAFEILLAMETGENSELITMTLPGAPKGTIKGNILAFLHGQKPIETAIAKLREMVEEEPKLYGKVDILPLFTKLSQEEQSRALAPAEADGPRRVVISTNVAETSLTVEGIVHVIETGLLNEAQWEPTTQTSFVIPKQHSQAGCRQRWGRAGRVQPGIAHCLYTEEQFNEKFPPYTVAEIKRAPIDQIVLIAKAAGVNDITTFDWIQPPSPEELARAPLYLKQIGALDADGDITEHGLELQSFAEEIDIANLMILGDRFGCAIEMATILPMIKLGGYSKLLTWNKDWDAATKYAVHKIHRGLLAPCLDDLEFYLKIWQAWEGTSFGRTEEAQRVRWSQQFFVNHELLLSLVEKRQTLIDALSGHKKDSSIRPLDMDLLPRLRIIMTAGLSSQLYQLETGPTSQQPSFKPLIINPEKYPELVELHKNAIVEISPESICAYRQVPDLFVCGHRRRYRHRESPLKEPENRIAASFIVLIKQEWLNAIEKSQIVIARLIARETRTANGSLNPQLLLSNLFIDQYFPIGARYKCVLTSDNKLILDTCEANPDAPVVTSSDEALEPSDIIEILDPETELKIDRKPSDKKGTDEITSTPIWEHLLDDDDKDISTEPPKTKLYYEGAKPLGQLVLRKDTPIGGSEISAIVAGYDFSDRNNPVINLSVPIDPDPFEQFTQRYSVGDEIDAEVVAIEHYVGDSFHYLIVREAVTGLEIILDPYDVSISGRNYPVNYLERAIGGKPIQITVEAIFSDAKRVRASRLKASVQAWERILNEQKQLQVDAAIVEVWDNKLFVTLDPEQITDHMPCISQVYLDRLPNRPDEMSLGQGCQVTIKPRDLKKKPLRKTLADLPEAVSEKFLKERVGNYLQWDDLNKVLIANKPMTYDQRLELLKLSDGQEYRKAVNWLFRRSNDFFVNIIDVTGIRFLADQLEKKKNLQATVVSLNANGATVRTADGGEFYISKYQLTFDPDQNLDEHFLIGSVIDLTINEADPHTGSVKLSALKVENWPGRSYYVGQRFFGTVDGFHPSGQVAFIRLEPGVKALLPTREISFESMADARDVLTEGQLVIVRITEIDLQNMQLRVTMHGLFQSSLYVPSSHIGLVIGRNGGVINLIRERTQTDIHINDAGFSVVRGQTQAAVEEAVAEIQNILKAEIVQFNVQDQKQFHKLWANKGELFKQIESTTGADIKIDTNQLIVKVTTSDKDILQSTIQQLRSALEFIEEIVVVPTSKVSWVIGQQGSTVNRIQSESGAYVEVKDYGQIIIKAENEIQANLAISLIEEVVGTVRSIGKTEYRIGAIENLRTPKPDKLIIEIEPDIVSRSAAILDNFFSTTIDQTNSLPTESVEQADIAKVERYFDIAFLRSNLAADEDLEQAGKNIIHSEIVFVSPNKIERLQHKKGDLITLFFGGGKSVLQEIQEETAVKIHSTIETGELTLSARSRRAIMLARNLIEQAIEAGE